ncbi:MAG: hypothetical protein LUD41_07950 [Phascolarctobacterium sp.]|nr:hypothetical protein [Phascolarctobacterium sp.]
MEIGSVEGNFTGNYAEAGTGDAWGGVIYNNTNQETHFTITSLTENHATSEGGSAYSGGLVNTQSASRSSRVSVTCDIEDNYAEAAVNAWGGVIYNNSTGTLTVNADSLTGNYAKVGTGYAVGGGIYDGGSNNTITVTGDVTENYA